MELYAHQKDLLVSYPDKWLLMWGTGSGKSLASIELCRQKGGSTLVICPKSLVGKWRNDLDILPDSVVVSKEKFKKDSDSLPYYKNIVIDEAHFFSNYKSQLTKSLLSYLDRSSDHNVYLLTATPYLSSPWNIYSYALIFGHKWDWYKFKRTFFDDIMMGRRRVPVPKRKVNGLPLAEYIAQILGKFGNSLRLEDLFDVPEQIFQYETFELTKEQKKAMSDLTDLLPIVRLTKEHQICGGTLKGDGYVATQRFKSDKVDRLLELVGEHQQIAIVCRYNEEINYLYEVIRAQHPGMTIRKITGEVSGDERHYIVEEINKSTDAIVLVNAACSEGWEIPHIPVMVFFSYDFSLKNYIQMLGRVQRAGHIKKNVYLSLVVKGTVDEHIYKTVAIQKRDFQATLYDKA